MESRLLTVKVRTKAKERSVQVTPEGVFIVRTTFAPERDRANKDIITLLAKHFKVAKSKISLEKGRTSATKIFKITA